MITPFFYIIMLKKYILIILTGGLSFFFLDGTSAEEETIWCYECKKYFPKSQAASHITEEFQRKDRK